MASVASRLLIKKWNSSIGGRCFTPRFIASNNGKRYSLLGHRCMLPSPCSNFVKIAAAHCSTNSGEGEGMLRQPLSRFSSEQEMLREAVRRYTEDAIAPLVHKMEEEEVIAPEVIHSLFEQGFMGIEIPTEMGGSGMSFTDCVIIIEEIARVDPSVAAMVDIHNTLINRCFQLYGTEEQKALYLPKCAQDIVGSFCLSESSSGSDAFALRAKATQVEGGWKLDGAKQWISSSKEAGVFIIFATVDPSKKHHGITAFIVDVGTKGLTIGGKYKKMGIRASSTCEVFLENVFVPDSHVLGEIGLGYKIAIDSLNEGRIGIAAQMLGLAEGAFSQTLPYLFERKQFGSAIGDFQGVRFQIAELATEIEATRLLVYNAAALKENGYPFTKEAAMAKLVAGRTAEHVASKCLELFGGYGFTTDYPIEKFFRDSKIGSIYEGTRYLKLQIFSCFIVSNFQ
ncbi:short-chain-acyl-CoA dehydrogenase [Cardiosporidium cionae]|uniref:short-chain 2-methylacyl-CoA dehydrogenase n=1 Tax=Cardiosporidium cionae TaxID=476202 RepID=A0ABQ7JE82_9APIC|nr:short-chain-acyl-CoA dehydrogenase [Cardiosporidium cionae]|eukprot:KAF8822321.1 short-chain-acyl-CoA dehydrogenase [Cardiosporidium cionae]